MGQRSRFRPTDRKTGGQAIAKDIRRVLEELLWQVSRLFDGNIGCRTGVLCFPRPSAEP